MNSGKILDIAEELGSRYILTVGGLKEDEKFEKSYLHCATSDRETLQDALNRKRKETLPKRKKLGDNSSLI